MSTLSNFIRGNSPQILTEWETFARDLSHGAPITADRGRNHAKAMLDAIALDLETPQTATEQSDKSKGLAADQQSSATAAAEHGYERAEVGFTAVQMVAPDKGCPHRRSYTGGEHSPAPCRLSCAQPT